MNNKDHSRQEECAVAVQEPSPRVPVAIEDWISVLILAALSLITLLNVLVRYFSSASIAWTEEISVFLMLVLTLVAGSAAAARNRHIQIEFLAERCKPSMRRWLGLVGCLAVVLMFALLVWLGGYLAWDEYRYEETSPGLGLPKWIYTVWLPVLSMAIMLRALGHGWRQFRAGSQKDAVQTAKEVQP